MNCVSCGIEVSPSFKHAFTQNICPACGGSLIDEESLALIEDLEGTLVSEATLRAETAHKLAVALVAKYDIGLRGEYRPVARKPVAQNAPAQTKPSVMQQLTKKTKEPEVMTAEQLQKIAEDEEISEAEREAIMADAVSRRYGLVDQITAEGLRSGDEDFSELTGEHVFSDSQEIPILERERMLRLQKQQQALRTGGKNSFTRSD